MEIADEHLDIIQEALEDYRRWFDDPSESDVEYRKRIDAALNAIKLNNDFGEPAFDDSGRCMKCHSKVSFADVTDTLVYIGEEIVKQYDGDITNRKCVKCHYPKLYPELADYDKFVNAA